MAFEPHAGTGLVDHVDGLVRQAMAGDVPLGKLDGRLGAASVICTRWCDS